MQSAEYERLDQKPYDSFYLHLETVIDHPVAKIWPHALNIGSWMSDHRLVTLDGQSGKVGHFERVFPRGLPADLPLPHSHLYGISRIIPHRYIAMEVFPERNGSYGNKRQWVSFDGILFSDLGNRTRITFLLIDAHIGHGDAEYRKHKEEEIEVARERIGRFFENLRRLVDASH